MSHNDESDSFFERERDRLTKEIAAGFEELLSSTNLVNRKMEEIVGMTKEYDTIASLWESFYMLMKGTSEEEDIDEQQLGVPGTGGHVVAMQQSKSNA
ncbi:hypothetical protein AX16_008397 [Volvariella volvacea WC 439]|nr:hypothetical protein AX16_008397 [Volvariella volvacea WC 439]